MRKNKKTIILAEIRRLIRRDVRRYNLRDELPDFWSHDNFKTCKRMGFRQMRAGKKNYPYYARSTRVIQNLAEQIYRLSRK